MTHLELIEVLQKLAHGVDPVTGEALPSNSPYQHPVVIRALFDAVRHLESCETGNVSLVELAEGSRPKSREFLGRLKRTSA